MKKKLYILTASQSQLSGSDILNIRTEQFLRAGGIDAAIVQAFPDWLAKVWLNSNLPFRRRLFKYCVARPSYRRALHQIERGSFVWVLEEGGLLDINCFFEHSLRAKGCRYLYELRDDVFALNGSIHDLIARKRLSLADLVIVPTTALRERVLDVHPTARVAVLEEPVDVDRLAPLENQHGDPLVIYAAGSESVRRDFVPALHILESVWHHKPFRLRVISGAKRPDLKTSMPWDWMPYSFERERQQFSGATIGLAPLQDSTFSRGKGAYKIKVYMAMGLAIVASPVGQQRDLVQDGVTGLWAENENSWMSALGSLLENQHRVHVLGQAARREAVRRFSHSVVIPEWVRRLTELFPELS